MTDVKADTTRVNILKTSVFWDSQSARALRQICLHLFLVASSPGQLKKQNGFSTEQRFYYT